MRTTTINSLPTSVDEFIELRNQIANTPEGGASIFLVALKIYAENQQFGEQCLVVAVDMGSLQEGNTYKGKSMMKSDINLIKSQLSQNPKIPNSYIKGTSNLNNYEAKLPYIYEYNTNSNSGNEADSYVRLFVNCSGADSPRPLHVKKNDKGIWKATNWSSVLVGIKKKPVSDDI